MQSSLLLQTAELQKVQSEMKHLVDEVCLIFVFHFAEWLFNLA